MSGDHNKYKEVSYQMKYLGSFQMQFSRHLYAWDICFILNIDKGWGH